MERTNVLCGSIFSEDLSNRSSLLSGRLKRPNNNTTQADLSLGPQQSHSDGNEIEVRGDWLVN